MNSTLIIISVALLIALLVAAAVFLGPKVLAFLIGKYLRKRRIAWASLVAVTLCTAMVLVVISVMGGWLRMFRESFHALTGDVIVHGRSPMVGFPYYQEIIDKVQALPEVGAAVPTIRTFGLINIKNRIRDGVQVVGYTDDIGRVNNFTQSLWRKYQQPKERAEPPSTQPLFSLLPDEDLSIPYDAIRPHVKGGARSWPGMIVGAGVVGIKKDENGQIWRPEGLYEAWANLKVLDIKPGEDVEIGTRPPGERTFWIVDDSRTQIWQYDANTVYVPFKELQRILGMGATADMPGRTTDVLIKVKPGVDLNSAKQSIERVVDQIMLSHGLSADYPYEVQTWEESQKLWLDAIENEKVLTTFLFGIISVVAIFLIFCIFYMIVAEKTKDIGIVKSVGATSTSIATIFLGYGLAIGIVGSALGFGVGYLIVHNINFLHEQLGRMMGIQVWKPEVYAFDTIPNSMSPHEVLIICLIAVVSSVLGALVPAIRAGAMNPVEALRWE